MSRESRENHNRRRRENRATRVRVVVAAEKRGEPAEVVQLLRDAPPGVAMAWGRKHQLGDVSSAHGHSYWPASADVVDRISTVLRTQGGHTGEDGLLAAVVEGRDNVNEGVNGTQWVWFSDGNSGYFKPVTGAQGEAAKNYGHDDPSDGSLHEVAAWRVAKALGPPWAQMVPACVFRSIDGELGSLAATIRGIPFGHLSSEAQHRVAVFDALIANQDRHWGNYLERDNDPVEAGLIDHGFAFAVPGDLMNASVFVDSDNGADLDEQDRAALRALLATPDLGGIRGIIRDDRADEVELRARRMLTTNRVLTSRGAGSAGLTSRSWRYTSW